MKQVQKTIDPKTPMNKFILVLANKAIIQKASALHFTVSDRTLQRVLDKRLAFDYSNTPSLSSTPDMADEALTSLVNDSKARSELTLVIHYVVNEKMIPWEPEQEAPPASIFDAMLHQLIENFGKQNSFSMVLDDNKEYLFTTDNDVHPDMQELYLHFHYVE